MKIELTEGEVTQLFKYLDALDKDRASLSATCNSLRKFVESKDKEDGKTEALMDYSASATWSDPNVRG